jgi:membrane associated rhomboid family serine protease
MTASRSPGFGGGFRRASGLPVSAPFDLIALLAVVFTTYTMQFFASAAPVPALMRLTPAALSGWQVWRLVTYPLAGFGPASPWILLELLVLYWFAADLRRSLGRNRFFSLLAVAAVPAAIAAVAAGAAAAAVTGAAYPVPFLLMQGQRTLLAIVIAAFAARNGDAVIYLFFVLPVRARAFVWVSVLIAFTGYLSTKDIGGLIGLWSATGVAFWRARRSGGGPSLRRLGLRGKEALLRWRLDRLRRRSRLRVVDGERGKGPTIN